MKKFLVLYTVASFEADFHLEKEWSLTGVTPEETGYTSSRVTMKAVVEATSQKDAETKIRKAYETARIRK